MTLVVHLVYPRSDLQEGGDPLGIKIARREVKWGVPVARSSVDVGARLDERLDALGAEGAVERRPQVLRTKEGVGRENTTQQDNGKKGFAPLSAS